MTRLASVPFVIRSRELPAAARTGAAEAQRRYPTSKPVKRKADA